MTQRGFPTKNIVDCSEQRLGSREEIDLAVYTVLTVAFGEQDPADRAAIQAMLPEQPTVVELVDAIFAFRRRFGPIHEERTRRAHAGTIMALFLLLGGWVRKLSPNLSEVSPARRRGSNAPQTAVPIAEA